MKRLISCVLLICTVGFAYATVQAYEHYRSVRQQTVRALATVKSIQTRDIRTNRDSIQRFFHPIFYFETEDGQSHFVVLEQGTQLRYQFQQSDEAMLVFPPDNPDKARLIAWTDRVWFPVSFGIAGIFSFLVGILFWRGESRTSSKPAESAA